MAAAIEINISGPKLSSEADLRNKKGKFASVKSVTKSACSLNKLNHARKMTKRRCIEDDAEAHAIYENIPRKITRQHSVRSP